jgi:hypothetical protein
MAETKQQQRPAAAKGNGANGADKAKEIVAFRLEALQALEQTNLRYRLNAPEGIEPGDLEDGERWAVCGAKKLRSFDVIEVVGFGGAWWAEVLCLEAQEKFRTRMKVLRVVKVDAAEANDGRQVPTGHEIRFDPQDQTYTAMRTKDNVPISARCSSWEAAFRQLVDHASLRAN